MHPLKRLAALFFMIACTSCATVSQQQQLNDEGNRAYLSARYQEALQRYEKTLEAAYENKDQQYALLPCTVWEGRIAGFADWMKLEAGKTS